MYLNKLFECLFVVQKIIMTCVDFKDLPLSEFVFVGVEVKNQIKVVIVLNITTHTHKKRFWFFVLSQRGETLLNEEAMICTKCRLLNICI